MIKSMLMVGLGGFLGTCARFATYRLCALLWTSSFPLGTFVVNIVGCLLFGIFSGVSEKYSFLSPIQSMMIITGFCGGFTTFSTFAGDICQLSTKGEWSMSIFYLLVSIILGILMVWVGRSLVQGFFFRT